MKKNTKKVLSVLLAALLCFGGLPGTIHAEDATEGTTSSELTQPAQPEEAPAVLEEAAAVEETAEPSEEAAMPSEEHTASPEEAAMSSEEHAPSSEEVALPTEEPTEAVGEAPLSAEEPSATGKPAAVTADAPMEAQPSETPAMVRSTAPIARAPQNRNGSNTLAVAQYTSASFESMLCGEPEGTAVYEGVWKAEIPMAQVLKSQESNMSTAASMGAYPWAAKEDKIAFVEYKVQFPEDEAIQLGSAVTSSSTKIIPAGGISSSVSGKTVTFKLPLQDVNWAGIYASYQEEMNDLSKTVKISIPYTVLAKSVEEAKAFDAKTITGTGEFSFRTGRGFFSITQTLTADVSTLNLTSDFAKNAAACFGGSVPTEEDVTATTTLDGDLLVNGDTQHNNVYEAKKADVLTITGSLNVAPIKAQMQMIEQKFGEGKEPADISLSQVDTNFNASLTLPEGMEFAGDAKAVLEGANEKFVISEQKTEGKKLLVTMTLKDEAKTFQDIKNAVNGVDDTLLVRFSGVKFSSSSTEDTNYKMRGTLDGNFFAKATHVPSGKVINFFLNWDSIQSKAGADSTAPNTDSITLTLKYPKEPVAPQEQLIEDRGDLEGDLLIGANTQHDSVYEAKKSDTLEVTGLLNVKPIKEQLKALQAQYEASAVPTNITVTDMKTSFTASLELPEGMEFTANPSAVLNGANDKFEITEAKAEGKKLTVVMTVKGAVATFKDIVDTVTGADDNLQVVFHGVKFSADSTPETNYTMTGTVAGDFNALATHTLTGNKIRFHYVWNGKQLAGSEDSTTPGTDKITLTVKYAEEQLIEADGLLEGDLLIGENTQHESVYEAKKSDTLEVTGLLRVKPIKEQLEALQDQFEASAVPTNIAVTDMKTSFTASLELPEGMEFTADPSVVLNGANDKFEITEAKVEGKKLTVVMTLKGAVTTFKDIVEAVNGADDDLKVVFNGVKFSASAAPETNYTMIGTVSGYFHALATHTPSGKQIRFNYVWEGIQLPYCEDSTMPGTDKITLTVKCLEEKTPEDKPDKPVEPSDKPNKPEDKPVKPANKTNKTITTTVTVTKTPKTGDNFSMLAMVGVLAAALAGLGYVALKKKNAEDAVR